MSGHVPILVFVLCLWSVTAPAQTVIQVPQDYPTIQQAIDASSDGDTVLVAPGTYFEQIDFGSHQTTVTSSAGAVATTIDATFLGPVVHFGPASTRQAVIDGFTITHGKGTTFAGGVEVDQGSPTISGNVIAENLGEGSGNGISIEFSSALVIDNQIANNSNDGQVEGGGGGGGIGIWGNPCSDYSCGAEIRNNVIEGNTTADFTYGGGIYINAGGSVIVIGNVIQSNSAPFAGGGIAMINDVHAQIENNLIIDNQSGQGGGVYWLTPAKTRGPFLVGNTLVNNQAADGSAVYADGFDVAARIINNMIVGSSGSSAVDCGEFSTFPPVILNNDVYETGGAAFAGLCAGDIGNNGNISQPPTFFGPDDYRLMPTSPGIDAGLNNFATQTTDILGSGRIIDGNGDGFATIDMGAYEYAPDEIFQDGFEP